MTDHTQTESPEKLGERIRRARQARGWKGVELARRAEISPSALSMIEGGYGNSQPALDKVLAVLEMDR